MSVRTSCLVPASFYTHASLLTSFLCFFRLFNSCCSLARVFGNTVVNEFLISQSHTEWFFIFVSLVLEIEIRPTCTSLGIDPEVAVKTFNINDYSGRDSTILSSLYCYDCSLLTIVSYLFVMLHSSRCMMWHSWGDVAFLVEATSSRT